MGKLKSITINQKKRDVYDITVNKNHNFFANDILLSNCGEITLPQYGSCCLGSINIANFYDEKKNDVDWSRLAKTIHVAVRFLDNVLTVNHYPIPETSESATKSRRIGLGIMGLHYLLIKLGMKYGKKKSLEFIERFFATIRNESYDASIELAKERGAFPEFDRDEFLKQPFVKKLPTRLIRKIKKYGIRGASLNTVAPVGTTSMIVGVSSGIEPIFSPVYRRKYRKENTTHEEIVMDPLFAEYVASGRGYKSIVGSYDVSPEEHLAVQMAAQEYVDNSIAKTINLPKEFTPEELEDLLLDYADHLKGVTVYQEESRGEEPLQRIDVSTFDREGLLEIANKYVVNVECEGGSCEI